MKTYKDCYKKIIEINKEIIPELTFQFISFQNLVKNIAVDFDNQNLNTARSVTNAAKLMSDLHYGFNDGENKEAGKLIRKLANFDNKLNTWAQGLNTRLMDNKEEFSFKCKEFNRQNTEMIDNLHNNSLSSEELFVAIEKLKNDIKEYTEYDILMYKKNFTSFLERVNSEADTIFSLERELKAKDPSLAQRKYKQWIYINDDFYDNHSGKYFNAEEKSV